MTLVIDYVEWNCSFEYKQLTSSKKEWLCGRLFYFTLNDTTWCLQIDRSDATKLGVYLTLINGAPCTLCSYTLSMSTYKEPNLYIFMNKCNLNRTFPSNSFSWGFENFCTQSELKDERKLICHPKTKLVNLRCTMNIEVLIPNHIIDDHRLATDLFYFYSLEHWIEFLRNTYDLTELTNRVNEEIEARLTLKTK